jgi:GNAT superfamily N-acetyltransferase
MSTGTVEIRPYEPSRDLDGASRVVASAFRESYWPVFDEADPSLARDALRVLATHASHPLVADEGHEVVGVLLGTLGLGRARAIGALGVVATRLLPGLLLDRYGQSRRARELVGDVVRAWTPVVLRATPHVGAQGEVLLFAVQAARHGQGIGRALMDRFVATARGAGVPRIVLLTDTTMSWQFYPACGFRRIWAAPLGDAYRVSAPDHRPEAFFYALDVERPGRLGPVDATTEGHDAGVPCIIRRG